MPRDELRRLLLPAGVLFLLNAVLMWPLFLPGELPYRDSIEGGYAGMARFLSHHPNPWGWNPLVYCGTPTRHMYPPALLYSAAAAMRALPFLEPPYVYRLVAVTGACLGASTLYFLVWFFARRRGWAFAAALAYSVLSPAYAFFPAVDQDRGLMQLPWHFQVLAKYGEGPHNFGLMLIPLVCVALWQAGCEKGAWRIALAALLLAYTATVNWIAALALAWCCAMMLLTWLDFTRESWRAIGRALAASLLAYLLVSFWLTPALIESVFLAWPKDSFNYQVQTKQLNLLRGLALGTVVLRALWLLAPRQKALCWLSLCLFGFAWFSFGHYRGGADTLPESRRYAIEFELFLYAFGGTSLALFASAGGRVRRALAVAAALALLAPGAPQVYRYLAKPSSKLKPVPKEQYPEYHAAAALASMWPKGRVFATGGLRFRLLQWFDIPQLGGTFETGLPNRLPWNLNWHIRTGTNSLPGEHFGDALMELKAAAVEYVVVHGRQSSEHYRDYSNPALFEGRLEKVRDLGADDIYRVPYYSLAHLVKPDELPYGFTFHWFHFYTGAIDDPARPKLRTAWERNNRLVIEGQTPAKALISVKVNYDPGWRAEQNGEELPIRADKMGFMVVTPRPQEDARITLRFGPTDEGLVCAGVSAAAWLGLAVWAWRWRRRSTA